MLNKPEGYDLLLLLLVVALTSFGVVMVYSASSVMAAKKFNDSAFFLKRQGLYAVIGFLVLAVSMRIDYRFWQKLAVPLLFVSLLLLIVVLIPGIGGSVKGSSRWIKLPFMNLQPAEFAKMSLVIYLAHSVTRKQDRIKQLMAGFVPYMIILVVLISLLLGQPDLGSALTLAAITMVMLFVAGTRIKFMIGTFLVAMPFVGFLVYTKAYRWRRIMAFLDPEQDPTGIGWQVIQSKYAFGAGGLLGQGLGEGKQKMFYLPEAHTDFILAVIGEELGFIGVLVIIAMFFVLVQRTVKIAINTHEPFGRFLAFGIATLFAIQSIVNMGVATGALPTKGLAMPFLSYGGSSLLVNLFAAGLLLNISADGHSFKKGKYN